MDFNTPPQYKPFKIALNLNKNPSHVSETESISEGEKRTIKKVNVNFKMKDQPGHQEIKEKYIEKYKNMLRIQSQRKEKEVPNQGRATTILSMKQLDQLLNLNNQVQHSKAICTNNFDTIQDSPVKKRVRQEHSTLLPQHQAKDQHHLNIFTAQSFKDIEKYAQYVLSSDETLESQEQQQQPQQQQQQQLQLQQQKCVKGSKKKAINKYKHITSVVDSNMSKIKQKKEEGKIKKKDIYDAALFTERSHEENNYVVQGKKITNQRKQKKFYAPPVQDFNIIAYRKTFIKDPTSSPPYKAITTRRSYSMNCPQGGGDSGRKTSILKLFQINQENKPQNQQNYNNITEEDNHEYQQYQHIPVILDRVEKRMRKNNIENQVDRFKQKNLDYLVSVFNNKKTITDENGNDIEMYQSFCKSVKKQIQKNEETTTTNENETSDIKNQYFTLDLQNNNSQRNNGKQYQKQQQYNNFFSNSNSHTQKVPRQFSSIQKSCYGDRMEAVGKNHFENCILVQEENPQHQIKLTPQTLDITRTRNNSSSKFYYGDIKNSINKQVSVRVGSAPCRNRPKILRKGSETESFLITRQKSEKKIKQNENSQLKQIEQQENPKIQQQQYNNIDKFNRDDSKKGRSRTFYK